MELRQKAVLSEKLKSFIQSGNYESYVLELMNQSQIVFTGQYERNPIQSAGECDFFDVATHEKYEAKLPFDKKEGEYWVGRTEYDSPEVDPEVLIKSRKRLEIGGFYEVLITGADEYDLYGEMR